MYKPSLSCYFILPGLSFQFCSADAGVGELVGNSHISALVAERKFVPVEGKGENRDRS